MKSHIWVMISLISISFTHCFDDKLEYKNINFELVSLLDEMKEFLPVSLLMKTIEHYTINSREMEIELESCYINLTSKTHFLDPEEFDVQQRKCLSDFFNFYSLFQILRNIVFQFFGENCPLEFVETCKDYLERFEAFSERIEEQDGKIVEFLVDSDELYKRLEENFTQLKPETVHRVVMNSILNINKENFYQQLNDVLEITDQNTLMEEIGEEHVDEIKTVEKKVDSLEIFFEEVPTVLEDPMQHPSKYLLKFADIEPLEDMKIVFKNEENSSSLVQ